MKWVARWQVVYTLPHYGFGLHLTDRESPHPPMRGGAGGVRCQDFKYFIVLSTDEFYQQSKFEDWESLRSRLQEYRGLNKN